MLENLITSGRAIDIMLGFLLLEVLLISVINKRTGKGIAPPTLLIAVGAGICLMLAIRESLSEGSWQVIALLLTFSLFFHIADLVKRWQR